MTSDCNSTIIPTVDEDFLDNFYLVLEDSSAKNSLKFFCPLVDANEFDYSTLAESLSDAAAHYCLSRRTWEEYRNKPMKLARLVKDKFRKLSTNDGELGELMLYSFLETDLKAPKIATKMELKTNPNMYFNGADGVHYLKLGDGNYQIIYGESKAYKDLMGGIDAAIKSIDKFSADKIIDEEGREVRGISFERGLISAHIAQETFTEEDKQFITSLIYPKARNPYFVDTAFAVFVLFNVTIPAENRNLGNNEFRQWLFDSLKEELIPNLPLIYKKIKNAKLDGHSFYFYLVPFEDMENTRTTVLKEVLQ